MTDPLFDAAVPLPEGAHHVPGFLTLEQQRWLVARCREWMRGPVPAHSPRIRGHAMSVEMVCLGWHWRPYAYTREAVDVNGRRVLEVPPWMGRLARQALEAVGEPDAGYEPDVALVNWYGADARMGMHQDRDERASAPVVSLSVGDRCRFRFGNTENRGKPYQDLELASGDLFVFGGPVRFAYHGVVKVFPGTAPQGCGVEQGRYNITLRVTGLEG